MASGFTCADEACPLPPVRVADDEEALLGGNADRDGTRFGPGVVWVGNGRAKRIAEYGRRFLEGDAVFREVPLGLCEFPLKVHGQILPGDCEEAV